MNDKWTALFSDRIAQAGECIVYTRGRDAAGYGVVSKNGQRLGQAHRVSWELTNGPIPPGLLICHKCDNPPCINPDHLFMGTQGDNMKDMMKKGRGPKPVGGEIVFGMRVTDGFLITLDKWRGKQSPIPSRAQAIRDLVERGLSKSEKRA